MTRPLGTLSRIIAGILAVIWIGAGVVALILGALHSRWLTVVLGAVALAYGLVWVQVCRTGRYALWPFGRLHPNE